MAIAFTGTGGLFTRLGKLGKVVYLLNGDQSPLPAAFDAIDAQYQSTHQEISAPVSQSRTGLVRSLSGVTGVLRQAATATVLAMVGDDAPSQAGSLGLALAEVIRQMKASGDSVNACAVGLTPTALSGSVGTGVLVTSTKRGDGLTQENLFAEVARLVCSADGYTGGAVARRERFTYLGEPADGAGVFDWDWPAGSAAAAQLNSTDPAEDANRSGNLLTNGDLETWSQSPLQAENWAIAVGAWATDALRDATAYTGTYSLRFAATAALTAVYQQFGSAVTTGGGAGTAAAMKPLNSYAVNFFARRVSAAITTGTLVAELVDGSGTVINDAQGVANSLSVTLSTLTTSWAAKNGVFRLPAAPPSTVRLRLRLSVAPDQPFLVDDICLTPLSAPYAGGPGVALFGGATPFVAGDGWSIATTNDRGGASFLANFQALFDRFFGMRALNLLLPSNAGGAETIADSLITA